jgi:hypothetical protein
MLKDQRFMRTVGEPTMIWFWTATIIIAFFTVSTSLFEERIILTKSKLLGACQKSISSSSTAWKTIVFYSTWKKATFDVMITTLLNFWFLRVKQKMAVWSLFYDIEHVRNLWLYVLTFLSIAKMEVMKANRCVMLSQNLSTSLLRMVNNRKLRGQHRAS